MRSRLRSFLLTSALTFAPAVASATTISGLYVDGGSGYNEVQDQHVHANSPANGDALHKFSVNHGTGFTGFGAVGWGFGNGLRVEAEGLYNFSHNSYTSYKRETEQDPTEFVYPYSVLKNRAFIIHIYNTTDGKYTGQCYFGVEGVVPCSTPGIPQIRCIGDNKHSCPSTYIPPTPSPTPTGDTGSPSPEGDEGNSGNTPAGGTQSAGGTTPTGDTHNTTPSPSTTGDTGHIIPITHREEVHQTRGTGLTPPTIANRGMSQVAFNHNGSDESWGGFANVLYDFDLERLFGLKSIATPFIGGGAGYLWQRYNRPNTMIAAITGTHGGFSWQGIAGVAFDTGISGLQVVAQYRMIGQPGSFYNGAFNYGTEGGHANFDQRFNHQFIVGFRYAFQNRPVHIAPPSVSRAFAAAAAPAPVPARSYLVFFDWNQYALTSRARQIVVEAAHATTYVHTT
ncbi:MAG: hypothetical protein IIT71_04020, partial [Acetobacter sp.]|nr:hypothetical protein [Acetobacter sp.]